MTAFRPERETARFRNAVVVSVGGSTATVELDGRRVTLPVYGRGLSAGQAVLVVEQGRSLLVLAPAGAAVVMEGDNGE